MCQNIVNIVYLQFLYEHKMPLRVGNTQYNQVLWVANYIFYFVYELLKNNQSTLLL